MNSVLWFIVIVAGKGVFIVSNVDDFLDAIAFWQKFYPDICPRCGGFLSDHIVSDESFLWLCDRCLIEERDFLFENYDNWAIVVACRTVCGVDIKIF